MINLEIIEGFRSLIESQPLERAAKLTLEHQQTPSNSEMTIVITDNAQLRQLNRQYRGVDAPTDVLSFPAGYADPDSGATYLGDIILSYPMAAAQAHKGGHALEAELQLLVIHGSLHLLGHDHAEPEEKARMWAAQDEILAQLGLQIEVTGEA